MMMTGLTLGEGVYTIPDASRILHLEQKKLRRWIKGYWKCVEGVRSPLTAPLVTEGVWDERGSRALNFCALIEVRVFAVLREEGIPLQRIRRAHEELRQRLKTTHPFARQEIISDGRNILTALDSVGGEKILVNLTMSSQIELGHIVEQFCHNLDFGRKTQIAERYWPLGKDRSVVVDPHHSFGRPTVSGTNICTEVVAALASSGESEQSISALYGIPIATVRDAVDFEAKAA